MKSISLSLVAVLLLVTAGCGASKNAADDAMAAASPYVGTWALASAPNSTIQFMASGDVSISQGDILTSINRFQNTARTRYMTRLQNTGRYAIDGNRLTLYVTADWSGRGTGATRAADKQVESAIVFTISNMTTDGGFTLEKVSMNQPDGGDMNADESLSFTLVRAQ